MDRSVVIVGGLLVVNAPLFVLLGRLLFGNVQGFLDALVFWFKPDLWSLFQGHYLEDIWAEMKLGAFVATCSVAIGAEYHLVSTWLG